MSVVSREIWSQMLQPSLPQSPLSSQVLGVMVVDFREKGSFVEKCVGIRAGQGCFSCT